MDVIIHHGFSADGIYWQATCRLEEDPNLSAGDTVEAVYNLWPATVDEVNYIVEEDKKIYSLHMERNMEETFLDRARESDKWNIHPEE